MSSCLICASNENRHRIAPVEPLYIGTSWRIEHAYPCDLLGWLVITTERHVTVLHELTPVEWQELTQILPKATQALRELTNCEKEYCIAIGEVEGFEHIHFHVVPRHQSEQNRGTSIFQHIKVAVENSVTVQALDSFRQQIRLSLNI